MNEGSVGFKQAQVKKPLARDMVADAGFEFTSCTLRGRLRRIGYADSDKPEAADRRSSSSGGILAWLARWCVLALLLAGCGVLSYARGQASCAQSSCNAEPYALGSCAAERLQLASLLAEQGGAVEPPLRYGDSSSTLTPMRRDGQGHLKHVEIRMLVIYDEKEEGRLRINKVAILDDLSDLLKKHVIRAKIKLLRPRLGIG
jgi:hypothetical protein